MRLKSFFHKFRTVQWKLTFGYMVVTTAALLVVEMVFMIFLSRYIFSLQEAGFPVFNTLQEIGASAVPGLIQDPVNSSAVQTALDNLDFIALRKGENRQFAVLLSRSTTQLVIFDPAGRVVAANQKDLLPVGSLLSDELDGEGAAVVDRLLQGEINPLLLYAANSESLAVAAAPIFQDGQLVGGIFAQIRPPSLMDAAQFALHLFLPTIFNFALLSGLVGLVFGWLMSRGLVRRLNSVTAVTSEWGNGNLSQRIQDTRGDEISELAADLNRMAGEFQSLIQSRQDLAALEERNRIARDLHDSVKQELFAASMNLGAAQALWQENPEAAYQQMDSASRLARQAQDELTNLIKMLRPIPLEEKGLIEALREHLQSWERHSGIATIYQLEGSGEIPNATAQELFRVIQEALSNVSRHSSASAVRVLVQFNAQDLQIQVNDNGRGFNPEVPHRGIGLRSMKERIQSIHGNLEINSSSSGTSLLISVPLNAKDEQEMRQVQEVD